MQARNDYCLPAMRQFIQYIALIPQKLTMKCFDESFKHFVWIESVLTWRIAARRYLVTN